MGVISFGNGAFIFKFTSRATKEWVLQGGPWFILQRPLLLRKWEPGLLLADIAPKSVLFLIKL